ncbi:MAG TPA: phage holin family protein [Casimicrobiaceae bacterium]
MSERDDSRPQGGVIGAMAQLGASTLAMLRTRIELASVEFAEAREHIKDMVLLAAVGIVLGLFALLFASLFVIAWFWDSYRLAAVGGVTLFYIAITVLVFARLRKISRDAPAPFAATLEELEHDAAALRRRR